MTIFVQQPSPEDIRLQCRANTFVQASTSNLCPGYSQANVLILPEKYARDFRMLCLRNPVSCPLLGETTPGDPTIPAHLAKDADIRTDLPAYNIYKDGVLTRTQHNIIEEWKTDSVAFFIGCSFSFEAALIKAGLTPRHVELNRCVPMYKTKYPLCPSGVFKGHMIVSMRPYPLSAIPLIQSITQPFHLTHGEPVAYGLAGARSLGITDLDGTSPDFGDPTEIREGEVAVYWGCGVTPQMSVMDSKIEGLVIGHKPGMTLVCDMEDGDACVGEK